MTPLRRRYNLLLAASLIVTLPLSPALAAPSSRSVAASYLVQVNGQTCHTKGADIRRAPASLTKIMTALIVLERCSPDEVVTVTRSATRETGSRMGLRRGERLTVHDLLAATLMASANDACRALAEHVAGSQEAFVALMNAKARELHLNNTRFTNVSGHDHLRHYSSAEDIAVMSSLALRHPLFADLVGRQRMLVHTVNGKHSFAIRNLNRLIGRYPGALGVKTGTTPGAGQCLVALAQRENTKVLLVIMRARNRFSSAAALMDKAFAENGSEEDRNDEDNDEMIKRSGE